MISKSFLLVSRSAAHVKHKRYYAERCHPSSLSATATAGASRVAFAQQQAAQPPAGPLGSGASGQQPLPQEGASQLGNSLLGQLAKGPTATSGPPFQQQLHQQQQRFNMDALFQASIACAEQPSRSACKALMHDTEMALSKLSPARLWTCVTPDHASAGERAAWWPPEQLWQAAHTAAGAAVAAGDAAARPHPRRPGEPRRRRRPASTCRTPSIARCRASPY
jgi:hypothetical protein